MPMKTLANPIDRAELLRRLAAISTESQRRWGRMTVAEMVCHQIDALRVSMGEKTAQPVSNWFSRSVFKWAGLWFPRQWPQGVRTVPECDARALGKQPTSLDADIEELRAVMDRFTRRPREYALQAHPIFGAMTEKEWMRWGYLHMDHHLRQFSA
jgi:hypothetical protein